MRNGKAGKKLEESESEEMMFYINKNKKICNKINFLAL